MTKDGADNHVVTEMRCADRHNSLDKKLDEQKELLQSINDRLFVGNGTPSVMVRLDRIEQQSNVLKWVVGVIGGTIIVAVVGLGIRIMSDQVVRDSNKVDNSNDKNQIVLTK